MKKSSLVAFCFTDGKKLTGWVDRNATIRKETRDFLYPV